MIINYLLMITVVLGILACLERHGPYGSIKSVDDDYYY